MLDDCYFFLYSECKLKERCRFRHNPLSKDNLILCKNWSKNKKCRMDCPLRHSLYHVVKQRSDTMCYWEDKGGCTKYRCEFKHMDPSKDVWKEPKVKLLTEIIESKNIYKNTSNISTEDVTLSDAQVILGEGNISNVIELDTTNIGIDNTEKLNSPLVEIGLQNGDPKSESANKQNLILTNIGAADSVEIENESVKILTDDISIEKIIEEKEAVSSSTQTEKVISSDFTLQPQDFKSEVVESVENSTSLVENGMENPVKRRMENDETIKKIKNDLNIDIDSLDQEIAELEELLNNK